MEQKTITKYNKGGHRWYVRLNGVLVAGFISEDLADIFIKVLGK